MFKLVVNDWSVAAISMLSSCENAAGDRVRTENISVASCGSSVSISLILLLSLEGDGCTLLLIRTTRGRGASTDALSETTRPSLSVTLASHGCQSHAERWPRSFAQGVGRSAAPSRGSD